MRRISSGSDLIKESNLKSEGIPRPGKKSQDDKGGGGELISSESKVGNPI